MSVSFAKFQILSYLDLMCCGFGGALLLFLIASSSAPPPTSANQLVVIRCRFVDGHKAEIGLEYKPPGATEWIRPTRATNPDGMSTFAARSHPGSGADSIIVLTKPSIGQWQVRPYLVDFPAQAKNSNKLVPTAAEGLTVKIDAMGFGVSIADDETRESRLVHPGDTGKTVVIAVSPGVRNR